MGSLTSRGMNNGMTPVELLDAPWSVVRPVGRRIGHYTA